MLSITNTGRSVLHALSMEGEDDDDEIPLDSSCKTGLQLW